MTSQPQHSAKWNNYRKAKILVIEDNDDQWAIIESALKECLPEIQAVRTATVEQTRTYLNANGEAEAKYLKLILLDLYLPAREQGWGLLQEIKNQNSAYRQLPVVVLSVSTDQQDVEESYTHGGTSYIVKPARYPEWLDYFRMVRHYWWDVVTLPRTK